MGHWTGYFRTLGLTMVAMNASGHGIITLVDLNVSMHTKISAVLMQWVVSFVPCRSEADGARDTLSRVVVGTDLG